MLDISFQFGTKLFKDSTNLLGLWPAGNQHFIRVWLKVTRVWWKALYMKCFSIRCIKRERTATGFFHTDSLLSAFNQTKSLLSNLHENCNQLGIEKVIYVYI